MTVSLPTFERLSRQDHTQEHAALYDAHGDLIVQRSGEIDSVAFHPEELQRACYGFLTHSHPKSLPISGADLSVAAEYALTLRAVGIDEFDRQWDYTVRFPQPSESLAIRLRTDFDRAVKECQVELSTRPFTDRAWERESRHLALSRLAKTYGFLYQRIQKHAPLSEATRHEKRRLDVLDQAEKVLRDEWLTPLSDGLARLVLRHTDEQGNVPAFRLEMLRREASALIQRSFLGTPSPNGEIAPYSVVHGEVQPRSVFFRVLWSLMQRSAGEAVERHAEIMRKHLPEDLQRQFAGATIDPFDKSVHEIGDFDPLFMWLGPDGKRLLDRIWNSAGDMVARVDQFLVAAVTQNLNGSRIGQEILKFLTPGNKSSFLGSNGSWYAMRLARTEISAAYFRADAMAAQLDPMVESYSPYTAPEHACCDGCDDQQAGGPYPKDDLTHLPPFHANCICGVIWNLVEDIPGVIDRLRKTIQDAISNARRSVADFIGPLSKRFLGLLFGGKS